MKIDRLIGIITILQQKGSVTAPYLAERFEVSRRTISRDIEDICRAGIPIVTTQGTGGGISIMEGFRLDTTIFTREEMQALLAGLKSLDSVDYSSRTATLVEKLGGSNEVLSVEDDIMIDLSSFYKGSLSKKIRLLKDAIAQRRQVTFRYYYAKGEEQKQVEPVLIVFKWSAWYLFGYSVEREDFRLYKLSRLWELELMQQTFEKRVIPPEKLQFGRNMTDDKIIRAYYQKEVKYRLVEEYGPDCYTVSEDGRLYTEWGFTTYEDAVRWFLSFGTQAEVVGPKEFQIRMREETKHLAQIYESACIDE